MLHPLQRPHRPYLMSALFDTHSRRHPFHPTALARVAARPSSINHMAAQLTSDHRYAATLHLHTTVPPACRQLRPPHPPPLCASTNLTLHRPHTPPTTSPIPAAHSPSRRATPEAPTCVRPDARCQKCPPYSAPLPARIADSMPKLRPAKPAPCPGLLRRRADMRVRMTRRRITRHHATPPQRTAWRRSRAQHKDGAATSAAAKRKHKRKSRSKKKKTKSKNPQTLARPSRPSRATKPTKHNPHPHPARASLPSTPTRRQNCRARAPPPPRDSP